MANVARRVITGLALVGVAYALRQREGARPARVDEQIDRWKGQLRERLDQLQREYGPTLRKAAVAAGFMPGLRFRWRVIAAALPQIADALERATEPRTGRMTRGSGPREAGGSPTVVRS
jgi:hypothetical protein